MQSFMLWNLSLYDWIGFFFIYAFIGWWVEVVFHVVAQGIVVNRGYINGPLCPIYGCGMLAVLEILLPYTDNSWILFIGGLLLCSAIELVGGWALFHFFHQRWWDYTDEHFNLGGYVCLRFSIIWGFAIVFVMKVVHPTIDRLFHLVPYKIGSVILLVMVVIGLADLAATTTTVMKMKREFERLDALAAKIRTVSDALTEKIGKDTIKAETKFDESRVQIALGKAELEDLKDAAKEELEDKLAELKKMQDDAKAILLSKTIFGSGRIIKAFPDLMKRHH